MRTSSTLTFKWKEGPANGGAVIESYRVWYDQAVNDWLLLEEAVPEPQYTVTGL